MHAEPVQPDAAPVLSAPRGPPPAGGPDDYGTQSRPSNPAADPGLDDEIPF